MFYVTLSSHPERREKWFEEKLARASFEQWVKSLPVVKRGDNWAWVIANDGTYHLLQIKEVKE